jgi:hypothetical protein
MEWDKVKVKTRPHLPLVGEYVNSVIAGIASEQKEEDLATLQSLWPSIVGDRIGGVSKPVALSQGNLTLKVRSAAWRQELHSQTPLIITAIHEKFSDITVGNIIFR